MYVYDIYDIKLEMRLFKQGKLRWRKARTGDVAVVKVHDSLE